MSLETNYNNETPIKEIKPFVFNEQEVKEIRQGMSGEKEITKKIEKWSDEQDKWVMATRETFIFSHFAKYWFDNGSPETKTWVLSKLGQNLNIKDRKLHIIGEKPFYLVEKMKLDIKQELLSLEPNKIPILSNETLSLPSVCLIMRRGRDSDSRCLATHPLSKRTH